MSTAIFVALQCCQCSTMQASLSFSLQLCFFSYMDVEFKMIRRAARMPGRNLFWCNVMQVKQRKKSSNKWICVVCNQKQSVRKVFAQGPKAKDLRLFVQSFNMSRKIADENQPPESVTEVDEWDGGHRMVLGDQRKRRTDWTEYLEAEDHQEQVVTQEEGGDLEPKFVTELPKEMFKRPKLRNYGGGEGGRDSYKPVFSKRKAISQDEKPLECQKMKDNRTIGASQRGDCQSMAETHKESRTWESKTPRGTSKWNAYITQEDDDGLRFRGGKTAADQIMCEWGNAILESNTDYQKVEDDIHPDFL
ncbi:hypothetical protein SLA2020_469130 [Shorea laevis]